MQGTCVGDVGVNALLEAELALTAEVIALPVARSVGALAPVLLDVAAVDDELCRGAFVEAGEVAAHHEEVRAHCQSQSHVIIVDKTAVRADGNVDAGLFEILVTSGCDLDERGGLTAADALGLAGDADRAAADTDLYEVCACLCEEAEAVRIDDVARADLDAFAVSLADELDGLFLPAGEALGGVDAQNVCACLNESGNALCVVAAVYARADDVALPAVEDLVGVILMLRVVLAENEVEQSALGVNDGQGVELVVPDDVVCFLERGALGSGDELLKRGHELGNAGCGVHAGNAVVAAGDYAEQLAVCLAVGGDCHGGVALLRLECEHVREGRVGGDVRCAGHEACLIALDASYHCRLVLDGLRAVDERNAALLGKRNCHRVVGNGLHDGGSEGSVERNGAFLAFLEFHQRSFEGHVIGDAVLARVAGDKKILAESP